jgi:hypothetical protein
MVLAALLISFAAQEEMRLVSDLAKGQKFDVTSDLEFAGDAGPAKLHARLQVTMRDATSCSSRIIEFSGKGSVKRWSYDLQWTAGIDFGKTVIGHTPVKEAQQAAADLDDAFKSEWTVKSKGLEATLEGKPETFTFLQAWVPRLFLLPGPLPFAARLVKQGQVFEEGEFTWTVDEISLGKESKVASVSGKSKERAVRLGVDSRGFVSSLDLQVFEKDAAKPSLRAVLSAGRQP